MLAFFFFFFGGFVRDEKKENVKSTVQILLPVTMDPSINIMGALLRICESL